MENKESTGITTANVVKLMDQIFRIFNQIPEYKKPKYYYKDGDDFQNGIKSYFKDLEVDTNITSYIEGGVIKPKKKKRNKNNNGK
jgi:hypothetical protein